MYTDLRANPDCVQMPRKVVRENAARDAIKLAKDALDYAHRHIIEQKPSNFTRNQDRLFTMKSSKLQELLSLEDFWRYYGVRMGAGQQDFAEAILSYERDHVQSGTTFRPVD